jgi:predicted ATPase/class 3 adenylate cyclase
MIAERMSEPPSGTVTLLFSDIEGSTKLLQRTGDAYAGLLEQHRGLLRKSFAAHGGYEVDTEGDAFFVAFATANDAVAAASDAQQALAGHDWPKDGEVRVRMGIHTGEPRLLEGRYVGLDVHRAARVMASGHGAQVVISQTTCDLLDDSFSLRDLGEHRLKDLSHPQRLYQLQIDGLAQEFPALKTLENRPTNLPVQPTALIGRERELENVELLLQRDDVQLVTLTGPGGTGKTRLALQVAAEMIEKFASGVFFVSLAAISDPTLVVPTIAQTLGIREQGGERLQETLQEYLRDRQLLLVLDNFEQITAAAPSVASLLRSAEQMKLLVTSRTPLHLSGERAYDVLPLSLPDLGRLPSLEALAQYEAVALFIERAEAAKAGFTVTSENAPAIAEICVRLDGLPLAIELAAARVRALSPQALLSRLDQRLKLLTGGAQDLDKRQQTLRATIEWSYELLSEEEKILFARLGVFAGGCRLDAAEAVCDPKRELNLDLLDGLTSLVEKSLLHQKEEPDGEPRFWMLETIREYALESLDVTGKAHEYQWRYASHFLQMAEEAEPHLLGPAASGWTKKLTDELTNLRGSLACLLLTDQREAVRLSGALWQFWISQGFWTEGREALEQALDAPDVRPDERAQALTALGDLAATQGDYAVADDALGRAISVWKELGSARGEASATALLGWVAERQDDYGSIEELALAALALLDGADENDALTRRNALALLAAAPIAQGRYDEAVFLLRRALNVAQEAGLGSAIAATLGDLGHLERLRGNNEEAQRLLLQSLELATELNDPGPQAHALVNLSHLARSQGDLASARVYAEQGVSLTRQLGARTELAMSLSALLRVAVAQGDLEAAAPVAVDVVDRCQELGDRQGLAVSLEWLGVITIKQGDTGRGVRLFGAANSIRDEIGFAHAGSEQLDYGPSLEHAKAKLGGVDYERLWNEGAALDAQARGVLGRL